MLWPLRRLGHPMVTERFPTETGHLPPEFRGRLVAEGLRICAVLGRAAKVCPTEALSLEATHLLINRGRCIQCGLCIVPAGGDLFFEPVSPAAGLERDDLITTVPLGGENR